ncbi:putative 77 kDa echinoderm microtubule-associated protein [Paratrimastix pyriformis]|uniref:77 kDa echinoderm microtubule-associated protein n=1 Tax=Paratrimastix pyriformis TaxID=342808 RepID=A0ABQ8UN04_9EUKA|nr:putative 77 kDa echinoderm microtubule-associated protein [Paratrimastix pyriformis]
MGCGSSTPAAAQDTEIDENCITREDDVIVAVDPNEEPVLMSSAPAARKPRDLKNHIANRFAKGTLDATIPDGMSGQTFPLEAPTEELQLDYVFGYRGRDSRNNVHHLNPAEIVYPVAGTAVVHNLETGQQRFYLGHDNDIMCLAINPAKNLVATGQESYDPRKAERGAGKAPTVHLWDPATMAPVAVLGREGPHTVGVNVVSFSPDGRYLLSIGYDDNHTLCLWDVASRALRCSMPTGPNKILVVRWDPLHQDNFVAVGVKTVIFGLTFPAALYLADGTPIVGTTTGELYVFRGRNLALVKPVAPAVQVLLPVYDGVLALTSRQLIRFGYAESKLAPTAASRLPLAEGSPRAASLQGTSLVVGTDRNEVLAGLLNGSTQALEQPRLVQQGHSDELWGLEMCPRNPAHALTACDDKTVRRWDIQAHRALDRFPIPGQGRSLSASPDGVHLLDASSGQVLQTIAASARQVAVVKFAPNGQLLAVGTHDGKLALYAAGSWQLVASFDDSRFLRSCSADCELLFWEVAGRAQVTAAATMANTKWASHSCVIAWDVQGIWPADSDRTDINSIDLHPSRPLLAMGDDFRQVELARFPCIDRASAKKTFKGHSEHVTNVRWSRDGSRLVSCGGLDAGLFLWRLQ